MIPPDAQRVHIDRKQGIELAVDDAATIYWTVKGEARTDFAGVTRRRESFHYPNRALVAVADMAAFVRGAPRIDERVMQWTAGDAQSLYREAVRFGDRVLFAWGRNNARDLQTIGITTTEAAASALVASFRAQPLKGFKQTSPYFVEGRGGVSRSYLAPPSEQASAIGRCIDAQVRWYTNKAGERSEHIEDLATPEAAERRFDELELAFFARGGNVYEIEWMKTLRRRTDYTVLEWIGFGRNDHADPVAFARGVLADAGIAAPELPSGFTPLYDAVAAIPEAHWVRIGERVGPLTRGPGAKPGTEIVLDEALCTVATITRKQGRVTAVAVKRAKTLDAAREKFAGLVSERS